MVDVNQELEKLQAQIRRDTTLLDMANAGLRQAQDERDLARAECEAKAQQITDLRVQLHAAWAELARFQNVDCGEMVRKIEEEFGPSAPHLKPQQPPWYVAALLALVRQLTVELQRERQGATALIKQVKIVGQAARQEQNGETIIRSLCRFAECSYGPEKCGHADDKAFRAASNVLLALRVAHGVWEDSAGDVVHVWSNGAGWRDRRVRPRGATWAEVESLAARLLGEQDARSARPKKTVNALYPLLGIVASPLDHWQTYSDAFESGMKARACTFGVDEEGWCYSACKASRDGDCYDKDCPQAVNWQNICPLSQVCRYHGSKP